jgi:hypothetical protein
MMLAELLHHFADKPVDLSRVGRNWPNKTWGKFAADQEEATERAMEVRKELKELSEKHQYIAAITHSIFLKNLTEDWGRGSTFKKSRVPILHVCPGDTG